MVAWGVLLARTVGGWIASMPAGYAIALAWPLGRTWGLAANVIMKQPGPFGQAYRLILRGELPPGVSRQEGKGLLKLHGAVQTISNIIGPFGPNFWLPAAYVDVQDAMSGWSQSLTGSAYVEMGEVVSAAGRGDVLGMADAATDWAVNNYEVDEYVALTRGLLGAAEGLTQLTGIQQPLGFVSTMSGFMEWLQGAIEGATPRVADLFMDWDDTWDKAEDGLTGTEEEEILRGTYRRVKRAHRAFSPAWTIVSGLEGASPSPAELGKVEALVRRVA